MVKVTEIVNRVNIDVPLSLIKISEIANKVDISETLIKVHAYETVNRVNVLEERTHIIITEDKKKNVVMVGILGPQGPIGDDGLQGIQGEGVPSLPDEGMQKVANLYVNPQTGKFVVVYEQ